MAVSQNSKKIEKHSDYFGQEVEVGDVVVFMSIGYRDFSTGRITKMSPKKATIKYGSDRHATTMQFYSQIIKAPDKVKLRHKLNIGK